MHDKVCQEAVSTCTRGHRDANMVVLCLDLFLSLAEAATKPGPLVALAR